MILGLRGLSLYATLACSVLVGTAHLSSAESPSYPIGAGDVLQITIYAGGEQQESFTAEVSTTGTITTPLLGQISINGLVLSEVSDLFAHRLSQGYYVNPQVDVSVKEYAGKVYVIGEVRRPGVYIIRDGLTVLNACILAGGFSDYAALKRVKVIRLGKGHTQVFKINLTKIQKGKERDVFLQPGDRIEVPQRRF